MDDVTRTCNNNTQIKNDGGENSTSCHQSLFLSVANRIQSRLYEAEKAWNTAVQNHYALDVNNLKERPVTHLLFLRPSFMLCSGVCE